MKIQHNNKGMMGLLLAALFAALLLFIILVTFFEGMTIGDAGSSLVGMVLNATIP